ncbi:Glucan endo-1,3-beta-glucosidase 2 [Apostasia shenzhenica]|uniref:Glucan endo-1,3-beta-glucosidase 2 n=1 Tax=Apostasia shenzhenica TaxID=1088818 RepID=A0A2I0B0C4_9ASPA|nr:Glucan endo-1,3-beta-glucosidase 2 [Apostasia shenzhenica]
MGSFSSFTSPPPPAAVAAAVLTAALLAVAAEAAQWCIARSDASSQALQAALDYACGAGAADCLPIQASGLCYLPNSLQAHASYAFNSFYQRSGAAPGACDFAGTATISVTDPRGSATPNTNTPTTTTPVSNMPAGSGFSGSAGGGIGGIGGGQTPGLGPPLPESNAALRAVKIPPSLIFFFLFFPLL